MPRFTRKYKKNYKKKRYQKGALGLAKKNYGKIKQLSKSLEYKSYTDSYDNQSLLRDTPLVYYFTPPIVRGTTHAQRIGTKITVKKIMIRGYLSSLNTTPTDSIVRIIIVRHRNNAGDPFTRSELLYTASNINSLYATHTSKNYAVIYDQTVAMDTAMHSLMPFKISLKLNSDVEYNTTDGSSYADVEKNNFVMLAYSTNNVATEVPKMSFMSRISYIDI